MNESYARKEPFYGYWTTVSYWKTTERYQRKTEADATALFEAINARPDGVLSWIMNYW